VGHILPVGTPGGVVATFEGIAEGSGLIRLGGRLANVDLDTYRLWRAAAVAPSVEDLVAWAGSVGIADARAQLLDLIADGFLVEDGPAFPVCLGELALRVVGDCLGNGVEGGPEFYVRGRRGEGLRVDAYIYEVLLRSDGAHPTGPVGAVLDAARPRPDGRSCMTALADSLVLLVRHEVVLVDEVPQ
jgi:hypothetical protein